MKKYITLTTIALVSIIGLTGCASQPEPPKPTPTATQPTKPVLTEPIFVSLSTLNGTTINASVGNWIIVELGRPVPVKANDTDTTFDTYNEWVCESSNPTVGTCENASYNPNTGAAMNAGVTKLSSGKTEVTFTNTRINEKVSFTLIVS